MKTIIPAVFTEIKQFHHASLSIIQRWSERRSTATFVSKFKVYVENDETAEFDSHALDAVQHQNTFHFEKKLIDESIIDGTSFKIDNRQKIQHFGERVRKSCHHVKKSIKHANITKNLYRSFTNSFMHGST